MSHLLAMSFDASVSPSITLTPWQKPAQGRSAGWGFAWYPADEYAAQVVKDPYATGDTPVSGVLRDWDRFRSSVFVCHVRGAAQVRTLENTHPFSRSFGGRDWVFTHNGQLDSARARKLTRGTSPVFEPIGHTDTEQAFCWLLQRTLDAGCRYLAEVGWQRVHDWFKELNAIGTANFILSDGHDLVVYRDEESYEQLFALRQTPPHESLSYGNGILNLAFDDPRDANRTFLLVSTNPLSDDPWRPVEAGQMFVVRRGSITWSSQPDFELNPPRRPQAETSIDGGSVPDSRAGHQAPTQAVRPSTESEHSAAEWTTRVLSVVHETIYRYAAPVEKSVSVLRLRPLHDRYQQVLSHQLELSVDQTLSYQYEDVFGNATVRLEVNLPYNELRIVSRSIVQTHADTDLEPVLTRSTLPLVWMPWQRQMMNAYLLPPELPESQLHELTEYAMSFVERHDYDLVSTLLDINRTIRRDFAYISRSTHLGTTPFEVYVNRRGVCQDFANLFICLARLLSIPARYRVGYILTGADYQNQIQSEASHAWVEVYLPLVGWRGFDPTNGCLAGTDHVRVASGRNYGDATPTSGTIFKGGGIETLQVSVRVAAVATTPSQTTSTGAPFTDDPFTDARHGAS